MTEHSKDMVQATTQIPSQVTLQNKAQPSPVALFVSDLHLTASMPKTAQAFFDFLAREASHAQQLYLLGDIFEYWAGDDDLDDPFNRQVVAALRAVSDAGTRIFWIAGNRDFLAGEALAQAAGLSLLAEPHTAEIAGLPFVLVHGASVIVDRRDVIPAAIEFAVRVVREALFLANVFKHARTGAAAENGIAHQQRKIIRRRTGCRQPPDADISAPMVLTLYASKTGATLADNLPGGSGTGVTPVTWAIASSPRPPVDSRQTLTERSDPQAPGEAAARGAAHRALTHGVAGFAFVRRG